MFLPIVILSEQRVLGFENWVVLVLQSLAHRDVSSKEDISMEFGPAKKL